MIGINKKMGSKKIRFKGDYTQEEVTIITMREASKRMTLGNYCRDSRKYIEDGIFKENISDKKWYKDNLKE